MLSRASSHENQGIRTVTRYISWENLRNFDGVLIRIHTIREGVRGDFGSITIALMLMWLMFTLMLMISAGDPPNGAQYERAADLPGVAGPHDALTRLLNRGALFERATAETRLSERLKRPVAVIQLDLDYFKSVNDLYGHHAGDRVLSLVASTIASHIRQGDLAGELAGRSFVLCCRIPR